MWLRAARAHRALLDDRATDLAIPDVIVAAGEVVHLHARLSLSQDVRACVSTSVNMSVTSDKRHKQVPEPAATTMLSHCGLIRVHALLQAGTNVRLDINPTTGGDAAGISSCIGVLHRWVEGGHLLVAEGAVHEAVVVVLVHLVVRPVDGQRQVVRPQPARPAIQSMERNMQPQHVRPNPRRAPA